MDIRKVLVATLFLLAMAVGIAYLSSGPDPVILDTELQQDMMGELTGTASIDVTVWNEGSSGEVEVTAVFRNEAGLVVGRASETVFMEEAETRLVNVEANVSDSVETYDVVARPGA